MKKLLILIAIVIGLSSCSYEKVDGSTKLSNNAMNYQFTLKDSVNGLYLFEEYNNNDYLFKKDSTKVILIKKYSTDVSQVRVHYFLFFIMSLICVIFIIILFGAILDS